jgi:GTP cyclohydrolase II
MTDETVVAHHLWRQSQKFRVLVHARPGTSGAAPASAAVYGVPTNGCLVRIHSRCVYAEAFESDDCDCRAQLKEALTRIDKAEAGVVIYLDQEGRAAGLLAKAQGYRYSQEHGTDTFASYEALGLQEDPRSYDDAADLLRELNLSKVTLLTNNPRKVEGLRTKGIEATMQPLVVAVPETAHAYLEAKRLRGHNLPSDPVSG